MGPETRIEKDYTYIVLREQGNAILNSLFDIKHLRHHHAICNSNSLFFLMRISGRNIDFGLSIFRGITSDK